MRAHVNGIDLFFDVAGPLLVPNQDKVTERPSIVLLHGGPGMDHTVFKPAFDQMSAHAQIVYVDQRACGRSEAGPRERWCIEQWADDVAELIKHLGLHHPIVLGTSFGGIVAQRFAAKYPTLPGGLVLMCTTARADIQETCEAMGAVGGSAAREAARRFFTDIEAPGVIEHYTHTCLPYYACQPLDQAALLRVRQNPEVLIHFLAWRGEFHRLDLRADLGAIAAPTLVIHGQKDPVLPVFMAEETLRHLGAATKRLVRIENCSHFAEQDAPDQVVNAVFDFFHIKEI